MDGLHRCAAGGRREGHLPNRRQEERTRRRRRGAEQALRRGRQRLHQSVDSHLRRSARWCGSTRRRGRLQPPLPLEPASAKPALAATADSIWLLSDNKTTLSRIDPDQNAVVAELRLPAGCNTLTFGETRSVGHLSRRRPRAAHRPANQPGGQAHRSFGAAEVPRHRRKLHLGAVPEGRQGRAHRPQNQQGHQDHRTGGAGRGRLHRHRSGFGLGQPGGIPVTRIDPATDKVVQQFWGAGGGMVHFGAEFGVAGEICTDGKFWRVDPKRVAATLAE